MLFVSVATESVLGVIALDLLHFRFQTPPHRLPLLALSVDLLSLLFTIATMDGLSFANRYRLNDEKSYHHVKQA